MDSSAALSGRPQMQWKQCDNPSPAAENHPYSRRTPSSSSSSSSLSSFSSYFHDDSPLSPATPLRLTGIPFSWEQLPGIPKKFQNQHKKKESMKLVPLLPPPATTTSKSTQKKYNSEQTKSGKKFSGGESFGKDPFFAALVECSKDDGDQDSGNFRRSFSDRFGFTNLYGSCKRTCTVSGSLVYIPMAGEKSSYGRINRRLR